MKRYFSWDFDGDGFQFWETAEEAKADAEAALQLYRDDASTDGWPEDIETLVLWGEIKERPWRGKAETRAAYEADGEEWPYSDAFDEVYDLQLKPVGPKEK